MNAQNGKLLWHNPMPVDSSLAVAHDVLYVGSNNFLYALNEQNGAVRWQYPLRTQFNVLAANGILYIATDSSGTYALKASNATLLWHNLLNPMLAGDTTIPVLTHNALFVGTIDLGRSPSNAYIYALNPNNGTENWHDSVSWNIELDSCRWMMKEVFQSTQDIGWPKADSRKLLCDEKETC